MIAATFCGTAGAGWALGHPQKIIDYGYRAVHVTAETSKAITGAFYGTAPKYSYFVGCSKGGGEAFMEAQRYPEDFDGIVGAANANLFTDLFSSFASRGTNLSKRASRRTIVTGTDVGLLLGKAAYDQSGSEAARAITNKRTGCLLLTVLTSPPYGRMPGMFSRIRYNADSAVR